MFEEWAGKAISEKDTASISFRNPEWNNEAEYINYMDEYTQKKNNAAATKPQNKESDYEKAKNDLIIDYPKLNPGDKIKILPYELQPDKYKEEWLDKWQKLCGCFVTIKKYDETEHGYLIKESNNCGWFPNEFDYSTLIHAENIQDNQTKSNFEYSQLYPGDEIMIKPFDKQPRGNNDWVFAAKDLCGKVVTIKDYDEIKEVYHLKESDYRWLADEFDFTTLIRANTNNYQDITNPTQEDFNNLQPGDMVLLKSVKDCNAECWIKSARDCCNDWVKINSGRMKNFYSAKNDNGNSLWIYFEYISAIRKKV